MEVNHHGKQHLILDCTRPLFQAEEAKEKKSKPRKADAHIAEIERLRAIVFALIQNNLAMAMALNQFGNARQTQEDAMCVTPALVATAALEEGGRNP